MLAPNDPYRGDRASLVAENERLRRELDRVRRRSPIWPVAAGLGVHVALRPLLDPWLNGASDAKWWTAVALLAAPILFSLVALARALRPH
jgi:hypothetical protein